MPDDDPRARRYAEPAGVPVVPVELPKGDVTAGVVRVGGTMRRPHQPTTVAVAGYLDHLERAGRCGIPTTSPRTGARSTCRRGCARSWTPTGSTAPPSWPDPAGGWVASRTSVRGGGA